MLPVETVREDLQEQANHMEQEARMVLPGIQALFGFQLVVLFNQKFSQILSREEQLVHLLAITMTVLAILLSMAPAAYHRQGEPHLITHRFVKLAGLWLTTGMALLAVGICLDFYLVARVLSESPEVAAFLSVLLFGAFTFLWFIFPRLEKARRESRSV